MSAQTGAFHMISVWLKRGRSWTNFRWFWKVVDNFCLASLMWFEDTSLWSTRWQLKIIMTRFHQDMLDSWKSNVANQLMSHCQFPRLQAVPPRAEPRRRGTSWDSPKCRARGICWTCWQFDKTNFLISCISRLVAAWTYKKWAMWGSSDLSDYLSVFDSEVWVQFQWAHLLVLHWMRSMNWSSWSRKGLHLPLERAVSSQSLWKKPTGSATGLIHQQLLRVWNHLIFGIINPNFFTGNFLLHGVASEKLRVLL